MEGKHMPFMSGLFLSLLAKKGIERHNLRLGIISDLAVVTAATEYTFSLTKSSDNSDMATARKIPSGAIFVIGGYRVMVANVKKDGDGNLLLSGAKWVQSCKVLGDSAIFDNTDVANEISLLEEVGQIFQSSVTVLDEDDNVIAADLPTQLVEQMISVNGIAEYPDFLPLFNKYALSGKYANPSVLTLPTGAKTAKMAAHETVVVKLEKIGFWVENLCDYDDGTTTLSVTQIQNDLLSAPKSCTITQSNLTESTDDCGCTKTVELTTTDAARVTRKYGIL